MKRLLLALSLVLALPITAAATDTFKNLPGVKDPSAKKSVELDADCSSRLVRTWPSRFPERNGLAERAYSCDDGGNVSVGSNRAPNLIEYRKFKEYYQSK
jgi:hypothetical protein